MRQFFRWMMRLLVLVVVFLVSLLTAMRFAIHGREVPVPKIVGLTPLEAQRSLEYHGLVLVRENRYFSDQVPEGRILSQLPGAGEKVRRGWHVRVAESMGPQRAIIPTVIGDSERAAELDIRRRGLDLGTVASVQVPNAEAETVVGQDPPPNATGVTSPKISLLIAAPAQAKSFIMPDFVGRPLDLVVKEISDAGFKIGSIHTITPPPATAPGQATAATPTSPSKNVATVVHQSPAPGQKISQDTAINVDVSR